MLDIQVCTFTVYDVRYPGLVPARFMTLDIQVLYLHVLYLHVLYIHVLYLHGL